MTTRYFRFLTKGGGWTWIQSCATVVHNPRASHETRSYYIVSVNYVLTVPEVKELCLNESQLVACPSPSSNSTSSAFTTTKLIECNQQQQPQRRQSRPTTTDTTCSKSTIISNERNTIDSDLASPGNSLHVHAQADPYEQHHLHHNNALSYEYEMQPTAYSHESQAELHPSVDSYNNPLFYAQPQNDTRWPPFHAQTDATAFDLPNQHLQQYTSSTQEHCTILRPISTASSTSTVCSSSSNTTAEEMQHSNADHHHQHHFEQHLEQHLLQNSHNNNEFAQCFRSAAGRSHYDDDIMLTEDIFVEQRTNDEGHQEGERTMPSTTMQMQQQVSHQYASVIVEPANFQTHNNDYVD